MQIPTRVPPTVVLCLIVLAASGWLPRTTGAQVPDDLRPAERQAGQVDLLIPTENGRLFWKDVASSLAHSLRLDAATVERIFPTGSLDLRGSGTVLALFGIDVALGDAVSIGVTRDSDGDPALRVRCDRNAIRFLASKHKPETAAIQLDSDWGQRTTDLPLVVCLHGLKSEPERFDEFRTFLRRAGFATAAASYDDHQSIAKSAQQLSEISAQLFKEPGTPKLVLVGHSMGGLVAREWTENPQWSNQSIVGLVTAGTPHEGSSWASLPPLLDLFAERKLDASDIVDVLLHQPSAPGMRELAPGSTFLNELNGRPRRADVWYTTVAGTRSPLTEKTVTQIRTTLQRIHARSTTVQLLEPRIKPLLESFDELARGKGDGVVAVNRSKIAGVDDVVLVDVGHGDYFRRPIGDSVQPVWAAILQRLNETP